MARNKVFKNYSSTAGLKDTHRVKTAMGIIFGQKTVTLDCRKMQSKKLQEYFLFTKHY
jgi:hypothetical protein